MEMNFEGVIRCFANTYMNKLTLPCFKVFLAIVMCSYGYIKRVDAINTNLLVERTALDRRTVISAAKILQDHKLIEMSKTKGGRSHQHGFIVNEKTIHGMYTLNTPVHGFDGTGIIGTPEERPASPVATQSLKIPKPKRTVDEIRVFKQHWDTFEKAFGHQLKTNNSTLQALSIWELINKAKGMDTDWEGFLGRVVKKFLQVIEDKPKGQECVSSQQALPHILNGERIWMRIVGMLPKNQEKLSAELTPAEEYKARGF